MIPEREVLLTGIGGQGVQLAARVLAEAAIHDGLEVQLFASYGGMMRGGRTDATVVVSADEIDAPPVVADAWAVLALHPDHLADPLSRLRPDGMVLVNSSVVVSADFPTGDDVARIELPLTTMAQEVGNPMAGALVAVGALARRTGIVSVEGLHAGIEAALPSYRRQHLNTSRAAIDAGADAIAGVRAT